MFAGATGRRQGQREAALARELGVPDDELPAINVGAIIVGGEEQLITWIVYDRQREMIELRERIFGAGMPEEVRNKALEETAYLLRTPANAKRLLSAVAQLNAGKGVERKLAK